MKQLVDHLLLYHDPYRVLTLPGRPQQWARTI